MTIRRISPFLFLGSLLVLVLSHAEEKKTSEPRFWRGIDTAGMDPSRKPWDDFYQYANGKWISETDIPSDRPAVYVFTLLAKHNREQLRKILDEAANDKDAAEDSIRGKVGAFYRSGMDEKKIEEQGVKPLRSELERIAALKDGEGLASRPGPDAHGSLLRRLRFRLDAGFEGQPARHRRVLAGRPRACPTAITTSRTTSD